MTSRHSGIRIHLLLLAVVFAATGCGGRQPPPPPPTAGEVGRTDLRQSPMLAARVEAGELPPLPDRLPDRPARANVFGDDARYGGTITIIVQNFWSLGGINEVFGSRLVLHRPKVGDAGRIVTDEQGDVAYELTGNLAESWEYAADGRAVTVKLREGLRYSDGHEFTTDDVVYRWRIWNDTEVYGEITPVPSQQLGGEPIDIERIDRHTFRFVLPEPDFRWFEQRGAHLQFWEAPKHWLSRWDPHIHPDTGDWDTFKQKLGDWTDTSRPALGPWRLVRWPSTGEVVAERNPYYYVVDGQGRQLPYIDRVKGIRVRNQDVAAMKVVAGQVDLYDGAELGNLALLKANERRGGYRISLHGEGPGSFPALLINFFTRRPHLADAFRERDFRVALSLAIDREEINQLVFNGFATPTNAAFGRWFRKRYATHKPRRAAKLLDGLGLKDRDGDGVRQYPGGADVTIVLTTLEGTYASVCELVTSHWRNLGIDAIVSNVHPNQYSMLRRNREYDVIAAHNGSYNMESNFRMGSWSPLSMSVDLSRPVGKGAWAPFIRWILSNGEQGQRPPADIEAGLTEVAALYERYRAERDEAEARRLARGIAEIWAEQVWTLGVVGRAPSPLVVSRRLLNLPPRIEAPPEGYWIRAGTYPYQLVLPP